MSSVPRLETPAGPGSAFQCLFDESSDEGASLPRSFSDIYQSDWRLPARTESPYVYSNFVISRDGRVSFNEPGFMGGGDVSGYQRHDIWLMALLRSRADAILVGDNTLRLEPQHIWTADYVFADDSPAFAELRRIEGRTDTPLQVFLSLEGNIHFDAAVFDRVDLQVLVATTSTGAERLRARPAVTARVEVLELGADSVEVAELIELLGRSYGVGTLLCEGGPRAYASLFAADCLHDEFLSLSPIVIGSSDAAPRPSLIEGVSFTVERHPRARLISVHRAENHLFLRSRFRDPS
jgi:riboflavin biosynthesis pyrimidine reductase